MIDIVFREFIEGDVEVVVNRFSERDVNISLHVDMVDPSSEKKYVRYLGESGEDLLSVELNGSFISAVELLVYENIVDLSKEIYKPINSRDGISLVGLTSHVSEYCDLRANFFVEKYGNCIRLGLSESAPYFSVLSGGRVVFEFDQEERLCSITLMNSNPDR